MIKKLLREPLFHFLVIAAIIFQVFAYLNPSQELPSRQIDITGSDLAQLSKKFESQWNREPTVEELDGLVALRIKEEILYREALLLSLDKNDPIVRRRMAQKMQFLAEDMSAVDEPSTGDLNAWYEQHSNLFAMPGRVSFRHIYFSPDARGASTAKEAELALQALAGLSQDVQAADQLGDNFMFQDYYRDRTSQYLGKEFDPQFAIAVTSMAPGAWSGPVKSGYGWHLVYVDNKVAGRVPDFEEVEDEVLVAWLAAQQQRAWELAYRDMRAQYRINVSQVEEQFRGRAEDRQGQ
jgi:peptidyl-prolyl cis-trans isomerase C